LNTVIPRAAQKITDGFIDEWGNMMLDRSDYRILISGANDEILTSLTNLLRAISPDVKVFLKARYGDAAVLNISYPDARPGEVEEFLRKSRAPLFRVRPADERHFELEVL
jgi:hypothetical protein